jgi:miniconductance mechanosensitive channel
VKLAILFIGAWVLFYICRIYIIRMVRALVIRLSYTWTSLLFNAELFPLLSWLLPVVVVHSGSDLIDGLPESLSSGIQKTSLILLVIIAFRAISISLDKFFEIYNTFEMARNRPIKGIIQVINIIIHAIAFILIFGIILDRSPLFLLSGLGAMTAILLLIFRDTILSLVAGIQLTTNNLIQIGDWIEMPQFDADGDVVDIALHTVRIQNWDKTITVIPTHKFLEHSFRNWRGMQESGGRRIKRAIKIDLSTVRFLTDDEISTFSKFVLLEKYIEGKKGELKEYNKSFDPDLIFNARRLTNIGTFRAYLINYLKQHPKINHNMTFLVRQLAPQSDGLPIEIYVFVNDIRWSAYEKAQSDIFDHVIAICSEFGLRIHQNPTGYDLRSLGVK